MMARSTKLSEEAKKEEIIETPVVSNDDIQDLNIESVKLKRFRINGDNNAILELNTADLGISHRLPEAYDKLNAIMEDVAKELGEMPKDAEDMTDEDARKIGDNLKKLDANMREQIDYIFDAPVSEVCLPHGSMYDPFQGMYQYEHIIDAITTLYETNLNHEFNLMRKRVAERTAKYTKAKSPTKKYHR
jgi:hypothetical protein